MHKIPSEELGIEILNVRHDFRAFDCDDDDLNDFIKNDALKEQKILVGKTHVCLWKNIIVGFITLASDSIRDKSLEEDYHISCCTYHVYPCILIGRLAVDKKFQRAGIGNFLLDLAIGLAFDGPIGCVFLTTDPKEDAIKFYEDAGFISMEKKKGKRDPHRMYLDVAKAIIELADKTTRESLDEWFRGDSPR